MTKFDIDSKEAQLLIWLITGGFYTPLDTISQDNEFKNKISEALTLQKKAIKNLNDSSKANQLNKKLQFATNIICIISFILFHCSMLMTQSSFWASYNKDEIKGALSRFSKQNYQKSTLFLSDLKTICDLSIEIEKYLMTRKDLASDYYYSGTKPDRFPMADRLDYLIPVKKGDYSDVVSKYFSFFCGGYNPFNQQHVQARTVFNASCCAFDDTHVLVSKDVAYALIATMRTAEIVEEWANLIKNLDAHYLIHEIKASRQEYSDGLKSVFPRIDQLSAIISEEHTILMPAKIVKAIKTELYFVYRQDLVEEKSITLTTIDDVINQFLEMVQTRETLSSSFKKIELAHIKSRLTLPSFLKVDPGNTIILMGEGDSIFLIEKQLYESIKLEVKELL